MKAEMFTNKHPNTDGTPWGWFEIAGRTVGYWSGHNIKPIAGIGAVEESAMVRAYKRHFTDRTPMVEQT